MNILNTTIIEVRNAFGFPQFMETKEQTKTEPKTPQNNYKIAYADGVTDYFDELGVAI